MRRCAENIFDGALPPVRSIFTIDVLLPRLMFGHRCLLSRESFRAISEPIEANCEAKRSKRIDGLVPRASSHSSRGRYGKTL